MKINELTNAKLDQYTKAANADYDKAKEQGDSKRMYKRGLNLMKASGKKIDNDVKAMQKARGVAEASWINGKKQDDKELVWKQTGMSYEKAVEKYGKEHVRLGGKNKLGQQTVEVHVPLVAEGMFGISAKEKGAIMNLTSKLSDMHNMWDFEAQTFTNLGKAELEKALNYNPKYIKYALNLTSKDYEADM